MGESKDYVSRSDELGNIHISEEVLAAISASSPLMDSMAFFTASCTARPISGMVWP